MRLFRQRNRIQPGAVIDGKYVPDAVEPAPGLSWIQIVIRVLLFLLAILVIYLLFLFIRGWLNGSNDGTKKTSSTSTTQSNGNSSGAQIVVPGNSNSQTSNSSSSSGSSPHSGSSSSSSGQKSSSSSSSNAANQDLANSGPGDVAALFVGTTAVGALGFHIAQRKKYA